MTIGMQLEPVKEVVISITHRVNIFDLKVLGLLLRLIGERATRYTLIVCEQLLNIHWIHTMWVFLEPCRVGRRKMLTLVMTGSALQ